MINMFQRFEDIKEYYLKFAPDHPTISKLEIYEADLEDCEFEKINGLWTAPVFDATYILPWERTYDDDSV